MPVQFSHLAITESYLYGRGHELIGVFERARSEGVDIVFDMYPYTAAGIDLHQVAPVWLREGGTEQTMARLADPATRDRARSETVEGADGREPPSWESIVISSVLTEKNAGAVGLSIRQVSDDTGEDPAETVLRLMHEERDVVSAVIHNRVEGDVRYFLSQPMGMIGSDGNAISPNGRLASTVPHPRFYGTYPRVLGRYVREEPAVMSLEEAVYKCAGFPAQRLGLKDRGLIQGGDGCGPGGVRPGHRHRQGHVRGAAAVPRGDSVRHRRWHAGRVGGQEHRRPPRPGPAQGRVGRGGRKFLLASEARWSACGIHGTCPAWTGPRSCGIVELGNWGARIHHGNWPPPYGIAREGFKPSPTGWRPLSKLGLEGQEALDAGLTGL